MLRLFQCGSTVLVIALAHQLKLTVIAEGVETEDQLALLGGLGMGLIGALLPLTLFSGEEQTAELITHAAEIGVGMLIVLGIAKLFATSLLLATGWKGGYIFPIMFSGIAMGLAVNLLFPTIPIAVAVAATMAGALVAALKAPLFAALFTMVLVQKETAAVVAIAVVVSALLTALFALWAARRASQAESLLETARVLSCKRKRDLSNRELMGIYLNSPMLPKAA